MGDSAETLVEAFHDAMGRSVEGYDALKKASLGGFQLKEGRLKAQFKTQAVKDWLEKAANHQRALDCLAVARKGRGSVCPRAYNFTDLQPAWKACCIGFYQLCSRYVDEILKDSPRYLPANISILLAKPESFLPGWDDLLTHLSFYLPKDFAKGDVPGDSALILIYYLITQAQSRVSYSLSFQFAKRIKSTIADPGTFTALGVGDIRQMSSEHAENILIAVVKRNVENKSFLALLSAFRYQIDDVALPNLSVTERAAILAWGYLKCDTTPEVGTRAIQAFLTIDTLKCISFANDLSLFWMQYLPQDKSTAKVVPAFLARKLTAVLGSQEGDHHFCQLINMQRMVIEGFVASNKACPKGLFTHAYVLVLACTSLLDHELLRGKDEDVRAVRQLLLETAQAVAPNDLVLVYPENVTSGKLTSTEVRTLGDLEKAEAAARPKRICAIM